MSEQKPNTVSILFIIDRFNESRFVIEKLLLNCTETQVELLLLNNTSDDDSISAFAESVFADKRFENNLKRVAVVNEIIFNRSTAFNRLLKEVSSDSNYVCVFDCLATVSKNWLYDLIYFHSLFPKVGASAIATFDAKRKYNPLTDKNDELTFVWKSKNNEVENVCLFKHDILNAENKFNEEFETDYLRAFTSKIRALAEWENFYIPGQHITKIA